MRLLLYFKEPSVNLIFGSKQISKAKPTANGFAFLMVIKMETLRSAQKSF